VPILDIFIEAEMQLSIKKPAVVQEHRCAHNHVVGRQRRRGFLEQYLLSLFIYGFIVALLVRKRFTQ
jgi:hypothetical protein